MADDTPKLSDLGESSGAGSAMATAAAMGKTKSHCTKTHRGGGTPIYSAPELLAFHCEEVGCGDSDEDSDDEGEQPETSKAAEYTSACDVYSLGLLIWEVITGDMPWGREIERWTKKYGGPAVEKTLAEKLCMGKLRPKVKIGLNKVANFPNGCDQVMQSVVERCWTHAPEQRPQAQVLVDELEAHEKARAKLDARCMMFVQLDRGTSVRFREEVKRLKIVFGQANLTAKEVSDAAVDVLKQIEDMLREICLMNGLANEKEGGLVTSRGRSVCVMGGYLTQCKALKKHLTKPLLSALHNPVKLDRDIISHARGLLYDASKGRKYCGIAEKLLDEVSGAEFFQLKLNATA
jgi:serine/threonine protein kinase